MLYTFFIHVPRHSPLFVYWHTFFRIYSSGECPHGVNCKFSHNPKHGGKRSKNGDNTTSNNTDENCDQKEKKENGDTATATAVSSDMKGTKIRKERSLRKKGKGWRNK